MVNKDILMEAVRNKELHPNQRADLLRESGAILYEVIGGSQSHGTSLPSSDKDIRGVFSLPISQYTSLHNPEKQISDDRELDNGDKKENDHIFYTLPRIFDLLKGANPNCIELLWTPKDCIIQTSPEFDLVIANRNLFISKACLGSHFGYANDQISKAKGKNKKVNNPQPKERPLKTDFCRIVPCIPGDKLWTHPDVPSSTMPFRPIHLKDMPWINLCDYQVAAVEHMFGAYRLYYYGEESRGVFRNEMLVCESIPMEDEWPRFSGLLLYDENGYEKAVKDWKSYWDWMKNRNPLRWENQENGLLNFDQKNMCHCIRLLMSGINIIKNGEPIVRFTGDQLKYLMDIRTGKITDYELLMADVNRMVAEMEELSKTSSIPLEVDEKKIDELYGEVSQMAWKRLYC